MLNQFPQLLAYSFFAPLIIRVGVGCALLYMAYTHAKHREAIAQIDFPLVGKSRSIVAISCAFFVLVGGMFIFGWHTQIAAVLAIVVCIKSLIVARRYPELVPYQRATLLLLIVMSVSLLLSGAGARAFDLPL
jgi:uncharacterized membrane protein YphA (DoxX/SURF4 family)